MEVTGVPFNKDCASKNNEIKLLWRPKDKLLMAHNMETAAGGDIGALMSF